VWTYYSGYIYPARTKSKTTVAYVSGTDTTVTVDTTSGFPTSGQAWIGDKYFNYTGLTSTQFTGVTNGNVSGTAGVGAFVGLRNPAAQSTSTTAQDYEFQSQYVDSVSIKVYAAYGYAGTCDCYVYGLSFREVGGTIIEGNTIRTGSVTATQIAANTITTAQLASSVGSSLDISSNTSITLKADRSIVDAMSFTLNNASGVSISGNTITKTQVNAWGNAGFSSTYKFNNGDYVEFRMASGMQAMVGYSITDTNQTYTTIQYEIYPDSGVVKVYESGTSVFTGGTWTSTDVFGIGIENNKINYYQNGTLIYTSSATPTLPLVLDVAMYNQNSVIDSLKVGSLINGVIKYVDTLQIGGRNLFKNSNLISGTSSWIGSNSSTLAVTTTSPSGSFPAGITSCLANTTATGQTNGYSCQQLTLLPNTQYTATFWVYVPSGVTGAATLSAWYSNSGWQFINNYTVIERNTWVKKSLTFTTNATYTSTIIGFGLASSVAGNIAYIANAKLELGPKSTDWCPAPEDSPNNSNIISTINISPEAITINASKINLVGAVTMTSLDSTVSTKVNNGDTANTTVNSYKPNWDDAKTKVDLWKSSSDVTKINGGIIYTGSITAAQIAVGTITADKLVAGTITAASGVIGSLDASKITTGTLSANFISGGTLTLGGSGNTNGSFALKNSSGIIIASMDYTGFKFNYADGSYTAFDNTTGLKWFKASTNYTYHYLLYSGTATVANGSPVTITLPAEFQNKNFKIIVSAKMADTGSSSYFMSKINCDTANINTAAGTFQVTGYIYNATLLPSFYSDGITDYYGNYHSNVVTGLSLVAYGYGYGTLQVNYIVVA
jgi:hypothetical protein